jgi:hypothetical protein
MKNVPSKTEELLVMLQCCHSVLSTIWPRPGYQSLAGAGRFIHTKAFIALQNADKELVQLFQEANQAGLPKSYAEAWEFSHRIISALKQLETNSLHPIIDPAFNLLYLATGVLYQEIAASLPIRPKQDARFTTVEDLKVMLIKCQWETGVEADLTKKLNSKLAETAHEVSTLTSDSQSQSKIRKP